jgi:rRNA maturation protein Nop10
MVYNMVGEEIFFNEKIGKYTLRKEIEGVLSIKRIPLKFKLNDSTARYRQELLRKKILG